MRRQNFAIIWDKQSPMFPEYNTLEELLCLDKKRREYGIGNRFYVPREYA